MTIDDDVKKKKKEKKREQDLKDCHANPSISRERERGERKMNKGLSSSFASFPFQQNSSSFL